MSKFVEDEKKIGRTYNRGKNLHVKRRPMGHGSLAIAGTGSRARGGDDADADRPRDLGQRANGDYLPPAPAREVIFV